MTTRWRGGLATGLAVMAVSLAGCSGTHTVGDPIDWARGVVGLSSDNPQDRNAPNSENLKQGNKEPYPNLASVPPPPETAMTRIDRDKLAQSLIADRQNAEYTDQQLRAGQNMAALPPPTAPGAPAAAPVSPVTSAALPTTATAATGKTTKGAGEPRLPKRGSEKPPTESPLISPSIANLPQGERAKAPPPAPPGIRHEEKLTESAPPKAVRRAAAARPGSPSLVAEVRLTGLPPNTNIVPADEAQLAAVARRAMQSNARIRIVGHGGGAGAVAEREFQSFNAALSNAQKVAVALTQLGFPANRIEVSTAPNAGLADTADIFLLD